jgi:hypothetical protein
MLVDVVKEEKRETVSRTIRNIRSSIEARRPSVPAG